MADGHTVVAITLPQVPSLLLGRSLFQGHGWLATLPIACCDSCTWSHGLLC